MTKYKQPTPSETKAGFTLVETALATALIAILLIAVAVIVLNIVSIYRKGMTLKTMNSVGRTLVEDFNTTIAASTPTEVTTGTPVTNTARTFDSYYRNIPAENAESTARGAFCPGTYSYVWQTNYEKDHALTVRYTSASGANSEYTGFRLLKIRDPAQAACTNLNSGSDVLDLNGGEDEDSDDIYLISQPPEELLANTDIDLTVYDLTVSMVDSASNLNQDLDTLSTEIFFSGTITLGTLTDIENATNNGIANTVRLDNEACDVGAIEGGLDGGVTTFDYCAVNRFKFAARAGSSDV